VSGRLDETGSRLSRGLAGKYPRARAARLGHDDRQSRGRPKAARQKAGRAEMARLAVQQIFTTLRDGSDAPSAAMSEAQSPKAHALAQSSPSAERSTRRIASIYPSAAMFTQQLDNVMLSMFSGPRTGTAKRRPGWGGRIEYRVPMESSFCGNGGSPVRAGGAANKHAIDAERAPVHSSSCGALLRLCEAICDLCRF
jgi:hypothetical protein